MNSNEIQVTTKDPFDIIKSAVDKSVDLIKPTFGPASNKVIISKVTHGMVVDDGVQILRDLELSDPNENAVLKVMRETAVRTNDRANDGTTGASIIVQGIVGEAAKIRRRDGHKIERELKKGLIEAVDQLKSQAKEVKTLEDLKKVARVSFDNEEIANIIAETWHKVGKEGVVTVEQHPKMETVAELSEGITIDHGYISPYMVNNPERMEADVQKPYILVTDYRITETEDLMPILEKIAKTNKKRLVIIAENVEQNALATLVINQPHLINPQTGKPGVMQTVAVVMPSGDKDTVLNDIAIMTGAKFFSAGKGDDLKKAELKDLGEAERFIAKRSESVIVGPKGSKKDINKAIADLSTASTMAENDKEREKVQKRLAFFANKVAVIKVGAATLSEQKAIKYKVDDAVAAVRSAYKGGVVCGSGLALARLKTSSEILNQAMKQPHKQLLDNMGVELERPLKETEALNVVTGKIGKYMEVGVIDPVDTLIAGLESAVSIACLFVTTSGMVVEAPKHIPQESQ